jgi:hypothetical protein
MRTLALRGRHDPFWDLEGVAVKRRRRVRLGLEAIDVAAALVLLVVVLATGYRPFG